MNGPQEVGGPRVSADPGGFARLLAVLDDDPVRAERRFRDLRRRLVGLFEWRGCRFPEDLVDETIERVAGRLAGGLTIEAKDPYRYFCGVAFRVFKETVREQSRREQAVERLGREPPLAETEPADDERLVCLERCLAALAPAKRELILGYYQGEKRAKIEARRRLTEVLGISAGTLRLRALRQREKLEGCVTKCLRGAGGE